MYNIISDSETLLSLEPEELAGVLLEYLNSKQSNSTDLNKYNFFLPKNFFKYPPEYKEPIKEALMEAWVWLEREGLLAPKPGSTSDWVYITRRGKQIKKATDLDHYQKANILPRKLLHPVIAQKVWSAFIRGEYDTAVFQSFKEVEVAVRTVGGYSASDFGVNLMRKAFHPVTGSLTDLESLESERESLLHLFSGAIGSYKNPHSHRNIVISPDEAVEMIILASHLLRIIDSKSQKQSD